MTTFATPVPAGSLQQVASFSLVPNDPALRFARDPIWWIGLPAATAIKAFATGCVARATGASNGIPGLPAAPWTAFQLSPLPQMDAAAFKSIAGGLPVQIVLVIGPVAAATPANDDVLTSGASIIAAPPGAGSTAFLGFAFQDRLCRDPLSAAEAIAASGACDANWPGFVTSLAALPGGRSLRVLDHCGAPMSGITVGVAINSGSVQTLAVVNGDTGIAVPAGSSATVTTPGLPFAIIGGGNADIGAFQAGLTLPAERRLVQVLDAGAWLAVPDNGVSLPRWHTNNNVEPLQDGTRYFTRLVADMRSAKGGGAVQIAGWAVVKGSLSDSTIDWPLVPDDASTTIMALVNELRNSGSGTNVRMLLNQFLQFDSETLDDFPELLPILFVVAAAPMLLQALASMNTDPAGYVVGMVAVAALTAILASSVTLDQLKKLGEYSKPLKDALDAIDPTIATWTPYPAAFVDNPLVAPAPFKILGHTIDDFSHAGVYHQKLVTIQPAGGNVNNQIAYLGGSTSTTTGRIHRCIAPGIRSTTCSCGSPDPRWNQWCEPMRSAPASIAPRSRYHPPR